MRALGETTLDYALRNAFLTMARDYEEVAEDLEHGAKPVRRPDLLPEPTKTR